MPAGSVRQSVFFLFAIPRPFAQAGRPVRLCKTGYPPYAPGMNPIKQIGKEMPLRGFRKQVFPSLNKAVDGLSEALRNLSAEPEWFYGFLQDSLVLIQGGGRRLHPFVVVKVSHNESSVQAQH